MSNIRLQCVDGSGNPVFLVNDSGTITASTAQLSNMNLTTQTVGTSLITTSLIASGNSNTIGSLITTGGNIGIGITTPGARLDVRASSETSGALIAEFGGSSNPRIQLYDSSATSGPKISFNHGYTGVIEAVGDIVFLPTGNVGISTMTPENKLDVDGIIAIRNGNGKDSFSNNQLVLGWNNSTTYAHAIKTRHESQFNNTNNAIDFYAWQTSDAASAVGSKHLMSITSAGVGIGTVYPNGTLHAKVTTGHATISIDSTAAGFANLEFYRNGSRISAIYRPANSDQLRVYMDGIPGDILTFETNGNIGVRNNSPVATLDINTSNTFGQLFLGNNIAQNRKLVLFNAGTNNHQFFGFGINSGILRYQVGDTSNDHVFYVGTSSSSSNEVMRIKGNGNVGIGTTAPQYKLHVIGDIAIPYGNAIRASGVTNTKLMEVVWTGANDQTRIYAPGSQTGSDTPKISIANNGRIGINTVAPTTTLDVRGVGTFGFSTAGSIALPLTLTNYNVNYGSSMGFVAGQGNQWSRLYDYNINQFGNNFTLDMSCQNSTYNTVIFANNWNGNRVIGINKQWPDYTLDISGSINVNGFSNVTIGSYGWLNSSGAVGTSGSTTSTYSIYATNRVAATEFNAYSDQRIKTDVEDVNDNSALDTIRTIQPKRYSYIDAVARGDKPVWGFIAQQVASVLDYSTTKQKEYIPNVYKRVIVTNNNTEGSILSSESLDTSVLDLTKTDDNKLRLKIFIQQDNNEQMLEVSVKQIISTTEIQIEEQLNVIEAFLYGQQVNDFHILNKDAIFTVSVAALQEVDRQLQTATETIISQDQTIDTLNQQLQDILARIVAI